MSVIALDRSPDAAPTFDARLAFDFATGPDNRYKDVDGRLHIRLTPISKATVSPYYGWEIPGWAALGLERERVYQMWRHPEELNRGAETFNNIQVMSVHEETTADDPREMTICGSLGTDCEFRPPYLVNSMVIWRAADIERVENNKRRQISAGYRYTPDMTPGIYEGLRYDGIMRDIRANHVALVEAGRAGPDVLVTDSGEMIMPRTALASRKAIMTRGALTVLLKPNLLPGTALALDEALGGVNRANWQTKKAEIIDAVMKFATPKLATDAKPDTIRSDLKLALDRMDDEEDGEAEDDEIGSMDSEEEEETKRMKREEADDKKARDKKARDAKAAKDRKAKDEKDDDDKDDKEDKAEDMKKAMDSAIGVAVDKIKADLRDATEARELVRPIAGKVDLAMDSAEAIYRYALDAAKVPHKDVHPSALKALVGMAIKQQTQTTSRRELAMDSASDAGIHAKFPMLARIGQG